MNQGRPEPTETVPAQPPPGGAAGAGPGPGQDPDPSPDPSRSPGADPSLEAADRLARRMAAEAIAVGAPTAWFERLYTAAVRGEAEVPWDRGEAHPVLREWCATNPRRGAGRRAVVIGCGFGDDAELIASLGYAVTAFDIAPTAVRQARRRFPVSAVRYLQGDLLAPPIAWRDAFELVVESQTVQAMPRGLRSAAIAGVCALLAPGGELLLLAGATDDPAEEGPPWRLTAADIDSFGAHGLNPESIERIRAETGADRWRVLLRRNG